MKRMLRVMCAGMSLLALAPARADWELMDPAKWIQLPDVTTNGVDIRAYEPIMLADDFLCTNAGPITDIHIWGSWRNDEVPDPAMLSFQLGIWTDIPSNQSGTGFSMPGLPLWVTNIYYPNYTGRIWVVTSDGEGWYDPSTGLYVPPPADKQIWQYNFLFDKTNAFRQLGSPTNPIVYWLSVQAIIAGMPGVYEFGWKTTTNHWNDDGVWRNVQGGGPWIELRYPPGHPLHGESMDLSFVLTTQQQLDFGDAPDPAYPTLLVNNGARHTITGSSPWLGPPDDGPDAEADGQPVPAGLGDDLNGYDDEDGVVFPPLLRGQTNRIAVIVTGGGMVDAWIDFNADGTWQPAERILGGYLPAGTNVVFIPVPNGAATGTTYARFRISTAGALSPTGPAADGEVEDHACFIAENAFDYGDAPAPFPTLQIVNGARHSTVPGVYLGDRVDAELNGQPNGTATGDDIAPVLLADDEDGILWPPVLINGRSYSIPVVASVPGILYGWIDFNGDGDWNDAGEMLAGSPLPLLSAGTNLVNLSVPPFAVDGGLFGRFRFVTNLIVGLSYTGAVDHGEVEDYEIQFRHADFGDAPAPYPTLMAATGALHLIAGTPVLYFGATVDSESEGMPDPGAAGDDASGVDDEDGVWPTGACVRGSNATFQVVLSAPGNVYGWVDFNADGDWADGAEQVWPGLPLGGGTNTLGFAVPSTAALGTTFARFRVTSTNVLAYDGAAPDGEVEDISVTILQPRPSVDVRITNLVRSGSALTCWWNAESNTIYQPERTTNSLLDAMPAWSNLGGWVAAPTNWITDPAAASTMMIYRVVVPYTP